MDVTVGHLPLTSGLLTDSLDTAEDEADAKEFAPIDGSDTKCVDEVPMSVETVTKISAGALLISPVIRPPRVSELLPATMPPDAESRELLEVGPDIRGDRFARCILPTTGQYHQFNDTIRQASPATIHKLIHGGFADRVDQHLVMDCRFPFEYDGGHIAGAINFWSAEKAIHKLFIEPELRLGNDGRTVIILYCEFSSHRAPTMFQSIRLIDEAITASTGGLLLPELYILEGGYSTYFDAYLTDCTPRSYRKMKNRAYIDQNSRYETMMRRSWEVVSDFANFADRPEIAKLMNTVNENGVYGVELDEWLSGGSQSPLPATRQRSRSPCTPPCQVLSNPT
jgi:rhodanese-related sulfurtransferase